MYSYVLGSVLVFVASGVILGSKNCDHDDRESESEDGNESSKGPGTEAEGEYNNTLHTENILFCFAFKILKRNRKHFLLQLVAPYHCVNFILTIRRVSTRAPGSRATCHHTDLNETLLV